MTVVDAIGQPCPVPVVKTKKAIEQLSPSGGRVHVLVDNIVACENLRKMAEGMGYGFQVFQRGEDRFEVGITVGAGATSTVVQVEGSQERWETPPGSGMVVAVGSDSMGKGDEELGRILIKGFLFSLTQLPQPPQAVVFFNGGVKLAVKESNALEDIQALEQKGSRVLVCGTCADYYNIKDRIGVGEITNMYSIVEEFDKAFQVVNI